MPVIELAGVSAGGGSIVWVELPDGTRQPLSSKGAFRVPPDARLVMEAPGSGGYGPPSARDPELLREDLADRYVIEEATRRDYGTGC